MPNSFNPSIPKVILQTCQETGFSYYCSYLFSGMCLADPDRWLVYKLISSSIEDYVNGARSFITISIINDTCVDRLHHGWIQSEVYLPIQVWAFHDEP